MHTMKLLIKKILSMFSPEFLESLRCICIRFSFYLSKASVSKEEVGLILKKDGVRHDLQRNNTIFALDSDSDIRVVDCGTLAPVRVSWGHSDTTINKYMGVLLRENQSLEINSPIFLKNSWLRLSFAPAFEANLSTYGGLQLNFVGENGTVNEICTLKIQSTQRNHEWSTFEIDLQNLDDQTGTLQLMSKANFSENSADSAPDVDNPVIVSKLTIAPKNKLNLAEARTFQKVRIKNEVGHFSEVYEHAMYKTKEYGDQAISINRLDAPDIANLQKPLPVFQASSPIAGESVYGYASRLLSENITLNQIFFSKRLQEMSDRKSSLKILSLCSGSARTEAGFDEFTKNACEWTLQDLNEDLLRKARRQFSPNANIEFLIGDVNKISKTEKEWDVIMCVSGLHHVVELERVIKFASESLIDDGEFWLIGEYVGRSGNRLQPDAQISADKIFNSLPARYRFNHHTRQIDDFLPRNDYSIDCFEGIRADEIEAAISVEFYPEAITRDNSFLWRLVNLAYGDNYDLTNDNDVKVLQSLVKAEVVHFNKNHDGTTLNAIYKKIY